MDDTITLRTSDDPPVELNVSRAVLAVGSKVFGDMLSIPSGSSAGQEAKVDLAEKEHEIKRFLRLLNLAREQGDPLNELEDQDWPVVAKLADKYDSPTIRAVALCKCWCARLSLLLHVNELRLRYGQVMVRFAQLQRLAPAEAREIPHRCRARAAVPRQGAHDGRARAIHRDGHGRGAPRSSSSVRASGLSPRLTSGRTCTLTQPAGRVARVPAGAPGRARAKGDAAQRVRAVRGWPQRRRHGRGLVVPRHPRDGGPVERVHRAQPFSALVHVAQPLVLGVRRRRLQPCHLARPPVSRQGAQLPALASSVRPLSLLVVESGKSQLFLLARSPPSSSRRTSSPSSLLAHDCLSLSPPS